MSAVVHCELLEGFLHHHRCGTHPPGSQSWSHLEDAEWKLQRGHEWVSPKLRRDVKKDYPAPKIGYDE